jgi:hypothetical protein
MMRQLQWEELDLVQALEVAPEVLDSGGQQFEVERDGLRLVLTLWTAASVVDVALVQRSTRAILLDCTVAVRGRIRFNNDERGRYLEFPDCVLVSRISFSEEQDEAAFNPNTFGRPLLVAVRPHLSILFE